MNTVVIVGAGVSGISAAMKLVEAGYHVKLLEAKGFPGGRIYSFEDNKTGDIIDNGQHVLIGAYQNFFSILNKLGTRDKLKEQRSLKLTMHDLKGHPRVFDASKFPGQAGLLYALLSLKDVSISSKLNSLRMMKSTDVENIDIKSVSDLLRYYSVGGDIAKLLWEPLVIATMNQSIFKAPARVFKNILTLAFFKGVANSRMIFPVTGLSELLKPLPAFLEKHNSRFYPNSGIESILTENNRVVSVKTKYGNTIEGDSFIIAVPPLQLRKLIYPDFCRAELNTFISEHEYSTIVSAYLWYDKELTQNEFGGIINSTIHWYFNKRRLFNNSNPDYPGHLAITISNANATERYSNEELIKLIDKEIQEVLNTNAKLLHFRLIRDKRATFSQNYEIEMKRPGTKTKLINLFIAGDWTNTSLPATIEGAAKSGIDAAGQIINRGFA